jgi:hypothetical protein
MASNAKLIDSSTLNRIPWKQHPKIIFLILILGGDLNFSIGEVESWGQRSQAYSLFDFFVHKLGEARLIDITPIRLEPTWRNKRMGEDHIAKRLDQFFDL